MGRIHIYLDAQFWWIVERKETVDWDKHYFIDKKIKLNQAEYKKALRHDKPFIQLLKRYVKRSGKILECGSGLGRNALAISAAGFRVTGIDISPQMVSASKQFAKNVNVHVKFEKADMFMFPTKFEKDSFDCITSCGVLEHFSKTKNRQAIKNNFTLPHLSSSLFPFRAGTTKLSTAINPTAMRGQPVEICGRSTCGKQTF